MTVVEVIWPMFLVSSGAPLVFFCTAMFKLKEFPPPAHVLTVPRVNPCKRIVALFCVGVSTRLKAAGCNSDQPPSVQASVPVVAGITRFCADTGMASAASNRRAVNLVRGGVQCHWVGHFQSHLQILVGDALLFTIPIFKKKAVFQIN